MTELTNEVETAVFEQPDRPSEDERIVIRRPGALPLKKAVSTETFVFLGVAGAAFGIVASRMGGVNMVNTMLNTASSLLLNTCFYIMAIAVIAGAAAALLSEFGVIALLNRLLSPLMKPLYGLPGASVISIFTCYLSDNPAILTLCNDEGFRKYFRRYQIPALTNIGTAFGMGMIVTVFMIGLSTERESFVAAALIGNLGAVAGSVISTRLFLVKSRKFLGDAWDVTSNAIEGIDMMQYRTIHEGNAGERILNAALEGGSSGVKVGLSIIPGVLIICTLVMLITNGPGEGGYSGRAFEGVAFLPALADKLSFALRPLFGFSSPQCVAVPITALGSAGAAIGLVPKMVKSGAIHAHDIAVFTAMCMCWSGYLSTHVAMMDALKCRRLTGYAILCHTIGGLGAGVFAHIFYTILERVL